MRIVALLAVVLLLPGCTWVRQELAPPPAPPAGIALPAVAKPETVRPLRKPKPRAERAAPAPQPQPAAVPPAAVPPPAPDYNARCHAMADNRAEDARQLGADAADQAKVESDTYHDCMTQSVK